MQTHQNKSDWDFFIAHAKADDASAEKLFNLLNPHARVFLDIRCLDLGDEWDRRLADAQKSALITVVIISSHSEQAYYQREEIAAALELSRSSEANHRVVPIYFSKKIAASDSVPYGLRLKHGITLSDELDFDSAAEQLLELLKKIRGDLATDHHVSLEPNVDNNSDIVSPTVSTRPPGGRPFRNTSLSPAAKDQHNTPEQSQSSSPGEGIFALIKMMQSPEVRECVIRFQTCFRAVVKQIKVLDNNKRVHDLLHTVQFKIYNYIVQQAKRRSLDDVDWDILMNYELDFRHILDDLKNFRGKKSLLSGEVSWIGDLVVAGQDLKNAVDNADVRRLKHAASLIKRVLFLQPSLINTRLLDAARALHLPNLLKSMEVILSKITQADMDQVKVRQFEIDISELAKLSQTLDDLIEEHDKWQIVDNDLHRIETMLAQEMYELEHSWPHLRENIETLCTGKSENWALSLKEEGDKLNLYIDAKKASKAKQNFRRYRTLASNRFYQVDLSLRNLCCNDLRKVGEPLSSVLKMIGE